MFEYKLVPLPTNLKPAAMTRWLNKLGEEGWLWHGYLPPMGPDLRSDEDPGPEPALTAIFARIKEQ